MKYSRLIFYFSLLVVFILSTLNANDIPRFNSLSMLSDKLVHLSIYAYLCFVGFTCKLKISKLSIETGAGEFFLPARNLFSKFGFKSCPPFAHYKDDPNSCYYTLDL